MPLYYFKCSGCSKIVRRILSVSQASEQFLCPQCQKPLVRTPKGPSSQVVERLDNNFMAKAVERPKDAERLYKERSDNDPRLKID